MESLYLWPERPAVSLLALWAISSVALWAARGALRELLERGSRGVQEACNALAAGSRAAGEALAERSRAALLARGGLGLQDELEAELPRVERGFSERLGQYSALHRKLEELLQRLDEDYRESGVSPPEVPGWTAAVETIAGLPSADHPSVKEILDGVQRSLDEAQRQALHAYRADAAERHEILDRMRSVWKEVRTGLDRTREAVDGAVESAARVDAHVAQYERVRDGDRAAASDLARSAASHAFGALVVFAAALAGAWAHVRLLEAALVTELPEGAAFAGVSGATLAAVALVALPLGLGVVALDLLGHSERLPATSRLGVTPRRVALGVVGLALLGLAVSGEVLLDVTGLGFVLPWLIAGAALPLETLLHDGRHVLEMGLVGLLRGLGGLASGAGRLVGALGALLPSAIDAYVSIPLRLETALARKRADGERAVVALETGEEVTT
jgi:hypothetical protein